jgi:hypothetical protein
MKINTFTLILSLLLAVIISYFLSSYQVDSNKLILSIGCFIGLFYLAPQPFQFPLITTEQQL